MRDWISNQAISLALPLILGPLTYVVMKYMKQGITAIDNAPPHVKQAIVLVLSFVLAGLVKAFGQFLPGSCATNDNSVDCLNAIANPDALKVILSALIAFALHAAHVQGQDQNK